MTAAGEAADREIRDLLAARARALEERDGAAFAAGYAPGAVIFDLAPPLSHPPDATGIASWMATWDGPIASEVAALAITVAGGLAVVTGLERLRGHQRGDVRDIWMRLTLCLARDSAGWRIVHEHVSLPVEKTPAGLVALTELLP